MRARQCRRRRASRACAGPPSNVSLAVLRARVHGKDRRWRRRHASRWRTSGTPASLNVKREQQGHAKLVGSACSACGTVRASLYSTWRRFGDRARRDTARIDKIDLCIGIWVIMHVGQYTILYEKPSARTRALISRVNNVVDPSDIQIRPLCGGVNRYLLIILYRSRCALYCRSPTRSCRPAAAMPRPCRSV
ncbi:hypothetical protein FA95DRAFT_507465 [Auriscalpium vulgare]|uniref:Uncharacterized protein n=1 Tax=Auriscalpium vulgare TaxID=40419 RepID=A0ACB8RFZ9_9AGAM|nr:hypothetical protein FA95DRAFT_507465 [Auriscalpium vulgare]